MALKSVLLSLAKISGWIQREQDPTWLFGFTAPAMQLLRWGWKSSADAGKSIPVAMSLPESGLYCAKKSE